MASISELAVAKRPNFLLLGAHPAIDFANTLVPPPGPDIEFLQSWRDVIDWMKETKLSDGKKLEVSESDAPQALERVRNLRHAWRTALEEIMAGHGARPQFIKQLNGILVSIRLVKLCVSRVKEAFICIDRARCSKVTIWSCDSRAVDGGVSDHGRIQVFAPLREYRFLCPRFLRHNEEPSTSVV